MYIKVLYDNGAKTGMKSGWGFSVIVDNRFLFDTGEAADSLIENKDRMMVSLEELEGVIISHDHWDHTGGLWEVLKRKEGLKVYACSAFSQTFRKCVKESGGDLVLANKACEISEGIFLTGAIKTVYKNEKMAEQAMILKGDKGFSLITGCAHPGIVKILKYAKKVFKIERFYMVFGGFHIDESERDEVEKVVSKFRGIGVEKVGPTHCSGEKTKRIFKSRYADNFVDIKAGHVIHL